jgi:Peptidase family M41
MADTSPAARSGYLARLAAEDAEIKRTVVTGRARLITAYHEAGHCVVGAALGIAQTAATILPVPGDDGGCDLGRAYYVPPPDVFRDSLHKEAVQAAAGRAAERLVPPEEIAPYQLVSDEAYVGAVLEQEHTTEAEPPPAIATSRGPFAWWPDWAATAGDDRTIFELVEKIHRKLGPAPLVISAHLDLILAEAAAHVTAHAEPIAGLAERLLVRETIAQPELARVLFELGARRA